MQWFGLILLFVAVEVARSQQQEFPYLTFMGTTLANHSYIDINQLGVEDTNELHCITNLETCCQGPHRASWRSTSGIALPLSPEDGDPLYGDRGSQRVSLGRSGPATLATPGIYHCNTRIAVGADVQRVRVYVGAYVNGGRAISL